MIKSDILYVDHVVKSIKSIESYTKDANFEEFCANRMMYDAVIRNLQILAESTQKISPEIKEKYTQIPWRDISGFRNILVHDYLEGIDEHVVWNVVKFDLPELKNRFEEINL